jgi:hypothetical protein
LSTALNLIERHCKIDADEHCARTQIALQQPQINVYPDDKLGGRL